MINLNRLLKLSTKEDEGEKFFGLTDIGKIRENNEDYFLINDEKHLFIVSDGMGGHNAGEVASLNAAKTVDAHFTPDVLSGIKENSERIKDEIINSIKKAHQQIREMSDSIPNYKGMGCTIVVALLNKDSLHLGHIGDSRAYLSDEKKIKLLTTDHTYVMELVKAGRMSIDEIRTSSIKNHLSQALGAPISISPDYSKHELKEKDRILLCTDGLWDTLSDREIFNILNQKKSKQQICKDFIKKANRMGGYDNITAVVIEHSKKDKLLKDGEFDNEKAGEYGIVYSFPEKENNE